MKIVVTGGAGFIGSNLIDKLLNQKHEVICIDNFDTFYSREQKERNIESHLSYSGYDLIIEDIRNFNALSEAIPSNTNAIIHLAAKAGVRPSLLDPLLYQNVNVNGTQNLLEIAKNKEIKNFIFASSSSVYGKNPNVPWVEEDAVLMPISPYASTKVSGELLGHVYSHLYDIRFTSLRFFTVYGPRQRPDLAIHKFLKLMSEEKEISLFGNGDTRRDYTYIDDITDGIILALNYNKNKYDIFNLGNNQTVSLIEMVKTLEQISLMKAKIVWKDMQLGDVEKTWADLTKSRKLLAYDPSIDFKRGLEKFYIWFENNSNN
jgi:UDP-glucuronate 4-epimerase